ncbi:hypothetical protein AAY473_001551 [Plecturocebus cupreus]
MGHSNPAFKLTVASSFFSLGLPPHVGLPVATTSTNDIQGSSTTIPQQEPGRTETAKASQATGMPQLCPLQVGGGEFGPTKVHSPFSLSDLKQIKVDLGKFSDDPDKYIDVLQGLVHNPMMPKEKDRYPTGKQAVPGRDPRQVPDSEWGLEP